jgi:4-diphosphocytidyl-2-C-methyl-D-erythritol kinase
VKIRLAAPAKINLSLRCLGRRPDGYHEIDTTMVALELCDRVEVTASAGTGGVTLVVDGPADVPRDGTNLVVRAAAAVLARRGGARELALFLAKEIPSAAGLGGGSSDAAAAAFGAALALGGGADGLAELAAELGSDCPFFLQARDSGLARCRGRGEVVEPLPALPQLGVLLVTPDVAAPTAQVYAGWRPADASGAADDPASWSSLALDELRGALRNDLEAAALRVVPGLAAWRRMLDAGGIGHARLAGSGSSFHALFATLAAAQEAAARMSGIAARAGARPRLIRAVRTARHGVQVLDGKRSG